MAVLKNVAEVEVVLYLRRRKGLSINKSAKLLYFKINLRNGCTLKLTSVMAVFLNVASVEVVTFT